MMSPAFLITYGILLLLTPLIFLSKVTDLKEFLTSVSPKQLQIIHTMFMGGALFLFSGIILLYLL